MSIVFLARHEVKAQTDSTKRNQSIYLGTGYRQFYSRDQLMSPLIYEGAGMPLTMGYHSEGIKNTHRVDILFQSKQLTSAATIEYFGSLIANYMDIINGELTYSYLHKINSSKSRDFRMGGSFKNFIVFKDVKYVGHNALTVDMFSSLNIDILYSIAVFKKQLSFELSYPVLSYVIGRAISNGSPPVNLLESDIDSFETGAVLASGDFMSVKGFVDFNFVVSYNLVSSDHINMDFQYRFQYYQYDKLPPVKTGIHAYVLSFSYQF